MTSSKISLSISILFLIVFLVNHIIGDKTLNLDDWILGVAFGISAVQVGDYVTGRKGNK